jgi:C1A family cysteine protease
MKVLVALVLLNAALAVFAHSDLLESKQKWNDFKAKFGKQYAAAEEGMRYKVFLANLARSEQLNAIQKHATFGVTKFSDLTPAEFKSMYLMNVTFNKEDYAKAPVWQPPKELELQQLPSSFDWRNKAGVVSQVYNQEQCGSCWAFSATETIESVWALANHPLVSLSEQQIVDCDTTDDGCDGGWPYDAYQYVIGQGGLDTLASYPYTAEDGTCAFNAGTVAAKIKSWKWVTQSQNEQTMQQFVYSNSPISICVDAEVWQTYTGGVITAGTCGKSIDHCVQITGWGQQSGVNVWNIRNSWGADWGNSGYIWVQRGSDVCALAQVVTVPVSA